MTISNQNHGYCITISGPQGDGKLILARAVLELLQEADVPCLMPEEIRNPYDGDSIEQLGHLRGVGPVVVKTSGA